MGWVQPVLTVILSAGAGIAIWSIFRGLDLWRNTSSRTEARGIANLEFWREQARWEADVANHRVAFYRDQVVPHLRGVNADLEYVIRSSPGLGAAALPETQPEPVMGPLPEKPKKLVQEQEKVTTGELDQP